MLAYLCGPIEFANGGGKLWRRKLAPFLREQLGHRLYDPAEDEKKNLTDEEMAHFREWKATEPERFRRAVRKIIHFDLDLIENKADYLICYWDDPTSPSGGTPAELTAAFRKGIPVYLVSPLPLAQVSGWMLGCADQIFPTVEELKEFLRAATAGRNKPNSGRNEFSRGRDHSRTEPMLKLMIAVGSTRRPKLDGVRDALLEFGPRLDPEAEFEIVGIAAPSGVRDTPLRARK